MKPKDIKMISELIDTAMGSLSMAKKVTPSPFLGKVILRRKTLKPELLFEDLILPTHLTMEEL
tara:strand:+ start:207 stop:395 length:189 start_codon:yes stop_codon:yes gene_type:complete